MGKRKTDVCQEFGLVNSVIQQFGKNSTKILMCLNGMDQQ